MNKEKIEIKVNQSIGFCVGKGDVYVYDVSVKVGEKTRMTRMTWKTWKTWKISCRDEQHANSEYVKYMDIIKSVKEVENKTFLNMFIGFCVGAAFAVVSISSIPSVIAFIHKVTAP